MGLVAAAAAIRALWRLGAGLSEEPVLRRVISCTKNAERLRKMIVLNCEDLVSLNICNLYRKFEK